MKRRVQASSLHGTYSAGVFDTDTDAEAIEQARESYGRSGLGRTLKDSGAFRFYVVARGAEAERSGDDEE